MWVAANLGGWTMDAKSVAPSTTAVIVNHYAGLFPSDLDDVAHRLDAAARQAIEQQSPAMEPSSRDRIPKRDGRAKFRCQLTRTKLLRA